MPKPWHAAAVSFESNIKSVFQLLDFDRIIVDAAVEGLRALADDLEKRNLHTAVTLVQNRATAIGNLNATASLRPHYETMFNQCVVLLVSYFDSGVHDVFRAGMLHALKSGGEVPAGNEKLTVSWRTLEKAEGEREALFVDLLITQKEISFQDMKSIGRAFQELLGVDVQRSRDTNNVILGQAARHVIVHAGSRADARMIKQVAGASDRTLKRDVVIGQPIRFTPAEVRELADSMRVYVDGLCTLLTEKFKE